MPPTSRSTLEERVQLNLNARGIAYEYEPCKLPYTVTRNYIPDLKIGDIYIEVKGYFRQDAQRKMRSMKEQHPELDIRFLFQRGKSTVQGAKKRKDGTKMTCAEWAEKHNFIYAEEIIPDEWFR
tara:strand:- start:131 stop:502 length:372 start_codon:yes stop_codon:yes gene_type:complete